MFVNLVNFIIVTFCRNSGFFSFFDRSVVIRQRDGYGMEGSNHFEEIDITDIISYFLKYIFRCCFTISICVKELMNFILTFYFSLLYLLSMLYISLMF